MKCPNCGRKMEKVKYDVGFGAVVDSFTCPNCRYNVTDEKILDIAMKKLKANDMVEEMKLKIVRSQ